MQNPYENDGIAESEIRIGRGAACALIAVFVLILLLPPLYRNVYQLALGGEEAWVPVVELFKKPADKDIVEHIKSFEGELEDKAAFTEPPRQIVQGALTRTLREGNRKTYIGRDGWLYLKPALDSLTGYGPLAPEPDSVAKDPNRKPWNSPLDAIETFAAQLDELGVELVLVPIPVKPMIYPEHITGKFYERPLEPGETEEFDNSAALEHSDAGKFYQQIEALPNVRVIDLSGLLMDLKTAGPIFLKQDTHWTPFAMAYSAKHVAEELGGKAAYVESGIEVENIGDLVEQLNLPDNGHGRFQPEKVHIEPVPDFVSDPTAKITLLGDSFTNIYSSESLNWGEEAGFAEHLSISLGQPLDVIAINGQGSTGVRRELARRGKEHLAKKKTVIWAIAARDFFLSESAARANDVTWENVVIPEISDSAKKPSASPSVPLEVTATLVKKSTVDVDLSKITYRNAYFVSLYKIDEVHSGKYEGETVLVADWAFQEKKWSPTVSREPGTQLHLKLVPLPEKPKIKGIRAFDAFSDDFENMELITMVRYWSEPLGDGDPGVKDSKKPNPARASLFANIACVLATLLVVGVAVSLRRSKKT